VQQKVLPEVTDEWAADASEFETVEELRADIRRRIGSIKRVQAAMGLRNGAVEALVELVSEEPPAVLVDAEVERRAHDLGHRLDSQGIPLEQYLAAVGRTVEQVIAEIRGQAIPAIKADLALRAVAEAESIEATEDDVVEHLSRMAAQSGRTLADLQAQVERASQGLAVRSDIKKGKALEWLVEHAEVVDEEGNPVDRALLDPEAIAAEAGDVPSAESSETESSEEAEPSETVESEEA
jgi:trigger factor